MHHHQLDITSQSMSMDFDKSCIFLVKINPFCSFSSSAASSSHFSSSGFSDFCCAAISSSLHSLSFGSEFPEPDSMESSIKVSTSKFSTASFVFL